MEINAINIIINNYTANKWKSPRLTPSNHFCLKRLSADCELRLVWQEKVTYAESVQRFCFTQYALRNRWLSLSSIKPLLEKFIFGTSSISVPIHFQSWCLSSLTYWLHVSNKSNDIKQNKNQDLFGGADSNFIHPKLLHNHALFHSLTTSTHAAQVDRHCQ